MSGVPTVSAVSYVPTANGDTGLVLSFFEADSQSFVNGDLVKLDAGGNLVVMDDPPGAADILLGIAQGAATNVTSGNTRIPVQLIRPSDVFIMKLDAASTFAETDRGTYEPLDKTAAGRWVVNKAGAVTVGAIQARILDSTEYGADGSLAATAGGPVYVRFPGVSDSSQVLEMGDIAYTP